MITNTWQKSTRSNPSGNCVEARSENEYVLVKDSKLGDNGPIFAFTRPDWTNFIGQIKTGITCPNAGPFEAWLMATGMDLVDNGRRAALHFTNDEWRAFVEGVADGQFDLKN